MLRYPLPFCTWQRKVVSAKETPGLALLHSCSAFYRSIWLASQRPGLDLLAACRAHILKECGGGEKSKMASSEVRIVYTGEEAQDM